METIKFIELQKPFRGYYSHEDWEKRSLRFRVYYSDRNVSLYGVVGEDVEVQAYLGRTPGATELTKTQLKTKIEAKVAPGDIPCRECGGKGTITIPSFDATKEEAELKSIPVVR